MFGTLATGATYDGTRAKVTRSRRCAGDASSWIIGMGYARALAILAKRDTDTASCTIGYVAYRKSDGHKVLFVADGSGMAHLSSTTLKQCKHTRIEELRTVFGLDNGWKLTLKDQQAQREAWARCDRRELRDSAPKLGRVYFK